MRQNAAPRGHTNTTFWRHSKKLLSGTGAGLRPAYMGVSTSVVVLTRLKHKSIVDDVVDALRARIIEGEISPGTALRENQIADALGVSRNTIREALRVLIGEGLLRRFAHRGTVVTILAPGDIRQIYEARQMIEVAAVRSRRRLTPTAIKEMRQILGLLNKAAQSKDFRTSIEYDLEFHRHLVAVLGNERLSAFHATLLAELRLVLILLDRSDPSATNLGAYHRTIWRHLEAGDRALSAELLSKHLSETRDRLIRIVEKREAADLGTGQPSSTMNGESGVRVPGPNVANTH
jgi:DNA-binding GntR family transcriptional regulator